MGYAYTNEIAFVKTDRRDIVSVSGNPSRFSIITLRSLNGPAVPYKVVSQQTKVPINVIRGLHPGAVVMENRVFYGTTVIYDKGDFVGPRQM